MVTVLIVPSVKLKAAELDFTRALVADSQFRFATLLMFEEGRAGEGGGG